MKTTRTLILAATVGLCCFTGLQNANADLQSIVDSFNTSQPKTVTITDHTANKQTVESSTALDLSAYASHAHIGNNVFYSFCAEPPLGDLPLNQALTATLSFSGGKTYNTSGNSYNGPGAPWALNKGAAWLYMQYATGEIDPQTDAETQALKSAITALVLESGAENGPEWKGKVDYGGQPNPYLLMALQKFQTKAQLWEDYIVGDANVTGNYAVFIMQLSDGGSTDYQDLLYIAPYTPDPTNNTPGGEVPEPASVLFWTLGSIGALGTAWRRRTQRAKCKA